MVRKKMGANRVHQRVDCDVDFEGPAAEWTAAVLPPNDAIEDDPNEIDEDSSSTSVTELTVDSSEIPPRLKKSQWNAKIHTQQKSPKLCSKRRRIWKGDKAYRLRAWRLWIKLQGRGCS